MLTKTSGGVISGTKKYVPVLSEEAPLGREWGEGESKSRGKIYRIFAGILPVVVVIFVFGGGRKKGGEKSISRLNDWVVVGLQAHRRFGLYLDRGGGRLRDISHSASTGRGIFQLEGGRVTTGYQAQRSSLPCVESVG